MADTRVLKERLKTQIAALEEKLRAVELVEQLSVDLGVNGEGQVQSPTTHSVVVEDTPVVAAGERPTVIDLCRRIALAHHDITEWTVGKMVPLVHSLGRPDAERTNVATSMRRLAEEGFFSLVGQDHKVGNIYRRKSGR